MTMVEELATFVAKTRFEELSRAAREQLQIRVLDALGCALGALRSDPVGRVRDYVTEWAADGPVTLIGGGYAAPDRAVLLNGTLVRYLDFNDSYLAPDETCHPSDNLAAVLAAAELANANGPTFLTALATAYQVQCRLGDVAPVRDHGFDHTTHLAYSAVAGAARALGLDAERTADAIAISGAALNTLRVTRTGTLSHWKGLAAPFTASCATQAVLLARHGITGPRAIFEGNKGFMQSIAGTFRIDWRSEALDRVQRTIVKRYNAEIHSQTVIQAALDLRSNHRFMADQIARVEIDIFDVAYRIIGGGEEGEKTTVVTKEDADHSLPYLVAVALLDGTVMPAQYDPDRIHRKDVQTLLARVSVRPNDAYSRRFPEAMACRVAIKLADGRMFAEELSDYPGFRTRPMSWDDATKKFVALGSVSTAPELLERIVIAVSDMEHMTSITELTRLLADAGTSQARALLAVA